MAEPRAHEPVTLVVAAFSRFDDALAWGRERLEKQFGPVTLASALYDFHQTRYYEATMGEKLRKCFLAFDRLVAPETFAAIKCHTNELEGEIAGAGGYPVARPLNLDPGLLSLGKFQLASTKDQAHRIYLGDGIFAENTLRFHAGSFEPWPWTYADYREPYVIAFLNEVRAHYRRRVRGA